MKAAVIGLGRMGAEPSKRLEDIVPDGWLPISHAEAMISTPGIELLALCDADVEKVERFKKHYNISKGYTDFKRMIDEIQPDFLSIATRTTIRKEIIEYAAKNGVKAIYAEKPLCNSLTECDQILSLLEEKKVILGYGVNRRYHDAYRKAKEIINSGELGELKEIVIENGHTNLLWTHPHSADIILFFAQSTALKTIQGKCSFKNKGIVVNNILDDDPLVDHAFFSFENGIQAIITNTGGINVRLACSKGNLTIHADGRFIDKFTGTGYFHKYDRLEVVCNKSASQNVIKELAESLVSKKPLPITPNEIRTGLLMLLGIVQSSLKNGICIKPEDVSLDLSISGKLGEFYA